jgi:hypothetical protein
MYKQNHEFNTYNMHMLPSVPQNLVRIEDYRQDWKMDQEFGHVHKYDCAKGLYH